MFNQEALPKSRFLSRVDSFLTDRYWRKLAAMAATFEKPTQQIHFRINGCLFCEVPIFVWVLINAVWLLLSKWVPKFMGCLFSMGAYYPDILLHQICAALYMQHPPDAHKT